MYKIVEEPIEAIKNNWKRYLISSLVTFVSAFLLFAMPQILDEGFEWNQTALIAVILTGVRVGVKAVWEIAEDFFIGEK